MGKEYNMYIVLTKTNTVFARLIRFYTKNEYSHASLSLDINLDNMYSFSRKYPRNPFIGSFMKEEVNKGVYGMFEEVPCVILEVKVQREQYYKAKKMIQNFNSNKENYKYNYRGIICNMINKPTRNEYRYFCSEFVYHVLKECKIIDLNKPYNFIKPQDLLNIEGNIIYEGNLNEYDFVYNKMNLKGKNLSYS